MAKIFEAAMLVCFGFSWPFSIARSLKARTAKGKSPIFLALLIIGYICGITAKLISGTFVWVGILYIADMLMVITDFIIYFRNRKLDLIKEKK